MNNINNAKCEVCGTLRPAYLRPQIEEKKQVNQKPAVKIQQLKKEEDDWELIDDWEEEQKKTQMKVKFQRSQEERKIDTNIDTSHKYGVLDGARTQELIEERTQLLALQLECSNDIAYAILLKNNWEIKTAVEAPFPKL